MTRFARICALLSVLAGVLLLTGATSADTSTYPSRIDFPAPTVVSAGRDSRIILPPRIWDWFWREVDELPPGRRGDKGKQCYSKLLAGKRVREALDELTRIFAQESSAGTE